MCFATTVSILITTKRLDLKNMHTSVLWTNLTNESTFNFVQPLKLIVDVKCIRFFSVCELIGKQNLWCDDEKWHRIWWLLPFFDEGRLLDAATHSMRRACNYWRIFMTFWNCSSGVVIHYKFFVWFVCRLTKTRTRDAIRYLIM